MTEQPRRSKPPKESNIPTGYRSTRRGSRSLKQAKRADRADKVVAGWNRALSTARRVGYVIAMGVTGLLGIAIALLLVASAINGIARWNAARKLANAPAPVSEQERQAQENLLIIGDEGGKAVGFLAMRVDRAGKQVFGIAIPEGAFLEVPGQGYERVGESYPAGPDVSLTAISNYLTVSFPSYAIVPAQVYRDLLKDRQLAVVSSAIQRTNLTDTQRGLLVSAFSEIPDKSVAFVPLPVKPIKLGSQTYFEPQRAEVADLLKAWWGVDPARVAEVTRVIVYNGAGKPGIAGDAAQKLIRGGFRVIDTKNADRFDYKTTTIVVQRGPVEKGAKVAETLGTGTVKEKRTDQNVSDIIVIIGRDYKASK